MTAIPRTFCEVYEAVMKLGAGSFGEVFMCKRKDTNEEYAVKTLMTTKMPLNMIQNEVDICFQLQHRNIIKILEYYIEEEECVHHLVFEMATGGELYNDILAKDCYSEVEASHCFEQILQGLAYIHKQQIVHRDLKPDNILFTETEVCTVVKIADFGAAMRLRENEGFEFVGKIEDTAYWMAPEMPLGQFCAQSVDLWACGTMLYIMFYGAPPFEGEGETLLDEMLKTEYLFADQNKKDGVSEDAKELIDEFLIADANNRLSAEAALTYPFIVKHKGESSRFHRHEELAEPMYSLAYEDCVGTSGITSMYNSTDTSDGKEKPTTSGVLKKEQESDNSEASTVESAVSSNTVTPESPFSASLPSFKEATPIASCDSVQSQDKVFKSRKRSASQVATLSTPDVTDDVIPLKRSASAVGVFYKSDSLVQRHSTIANHGEGLASAHESMLTKTSPDAGADSGQLKKENPTTLPAFDVTKPREYPVPELESPMSPDLHLLV